MLLAQYVMGVGGEEIQQFLTLLDLPHGKNYTKMVSCKWKQMLVLYCVMCQMPV